MGTSSKCFSTRKKVSNSVIIEQYITGEDYRILVINHRLVAAAKRLPAQVKGDGKSTVQQLIDQTNADPKRGYGHEKVLTYISIDDITRKLLELKIIRLILLSQKMRSLY